MRKAYVLLLPLGSLVSAFQPDPAILNKIFSDALHRSETVYGPNDPRTAAAARDLGFYLKDKGDVKAAHSAFSQALQIDQANFGRDARQTLAGVITLASVSPPIEAATLFRRAIAVPSLDPSLAVLALSGLGDLRHAAGDSAGAALYWRRSLTQADAAYGRDSAESRNILNSLAQVVTPAESVELMNRALLGARHTLGDAHPETATCEVNLAQALLKAGRPKEAAGQARQGLAIFEAMLGPRHPRVAVAASVVAASLRKMGQAREAETYYRRALEIDSDAFGANDPQTRRDAAALTSLHPK